MEESPALPSGSRLNLTLVLESPAQIEEGESDQWSLPSLDHGSDNGGEEMGVLERRELHDSPISVASSRAPL